MSKRTLLQPQEIEVFYIIPTIRKYLAMQMKANGLKQNKVAELLQIEEAAVSQYLNNKRGDKIILGKEILAEINISSFKIKDEISLLSETQKLLKFIRNSGYLCKIHKQLSMAPLSCGPEHVGCMTKSEEHNITNVKFIE